VFSRNGIAVIEVEADSCALAQPSLSKEPEYENVTEKLVLENPVRCTRLVLVSDGFGVRAKDPCGGDIS
jgi:hypothetical protein